MVLSFCRGPGSIDALKRRGFRGLKALSTENAVFIRSRQFRKRSSKIGCYRKIAFSAQVDFDRFVFHVRGAP